jgi:hypothetical protein
MATLYVVFLLNKKVKVTEAKEKEKLSAWEIMKRCKCGKRKYITNLDKRIK